MCFRHSQLAAGFQAGKKHLSEFENGSVVPARFNSDIIENHFNGNGTHPTLATYYQTINSAILGQTAKSRGRNVSRTIPSIYAKYILCQTM